MAVKSNVVEKPARDSLLLSIQSTHRIERSFAPASHFQERRSSEHPCLLR
ncbi:hypothetical protein M3J09_002966 [Ascochyta lentis]